jgi:hypothetical protein
MVSSPADHHAFTWRSFLGPLLRWPIASGRETGCMTVHRVTSVFAGFRFPPEVISIAVRWYLRYGLSYRHVEELLAERGVTGDHVTIYRWVQRFTPEFIEAARFCRHAPGDRWFADETYVSCPAGGPTCTGRLTSTARSSTCCCPIDVTWPPPGGSSSWRCARARSRPRSPPIRPRPIRGSWMSSSPQRCIPSSAMRTTRSRLITGG